MEIVPAETPEQLDSVRSLFRQYEQFLDVDLCFQQFTDELDSLPGKYAPPDGRLTLAIEDGQAAGCVAIRKLDDGVCEMKRLYVRPEFRSGGLGRRLAEEMISQAAGAGYAVMRLDTLDRLIEAMSLYESLGFRRTEPYYDNPLDGVVYWALSLDSENK
ncbi:MAG: GNAT family N-acetyltransferase [Phycisphaerae bacterium]|jgi:ribosomal protein S18 acetylase RimI-like enzyme|nr:GNAT family N-acetyltransferase [Phycisphaerae bacterium]